MPTTIDCRKIFPVLIYFCTLFSANIHASVDPALQDAMNKYGACLKQAHDHLPKNATTDSIMLQCKSYETQLSPFVPPPLFSKLIKQVRNSIDSYLAKK